MPALTIDTNPVSPRSANPAPAAQQQPQQQQQHSAATPASAPNPVPAQTAPRSTSPARPPVSPITPPLNAATLPAVPPAAATKLPPPAQPSAVQAQQPPATFAANRQTFTHAPIPDASETAIPPPAPAPIDFDSNPDVLALKSAISILQLQRLRATNDIRALGAVKDAALQNPEAFVEDLAAGRIRAQGDPLFPQAGGAEDSDSDSSDDSSDDAEGPTTAQDPSKTVSHEGDRPVSMDVDPPGGASTAKPKGKSKPKRQKQPWTDLPRPQNVVRCPPINWSQYAVAGDSLERLHAEQIARPSQGQPAVMGPGGTFEFRAGAGENQREAVGIAAPYTPGKDKLDKKPKGGRK